MDVSKKTYFPQIDIIKGIAIISVIALHTFGDSLGKIWYGFHIHHAVPIFILTMSVNNAISQYSRKTNNKESLFDLYSPSYFFKKIQRIVIPFLVIFAVALFLGIYTGQYYLGPLSFIGYLPVTGPGNYFITLLFQFILIFPLIIYAFQKKRYVFFVILCVIDFLFQVMAPHVALFDYPPGLYIYSSCILRYISLIALGMFLGEDLAEGSKIEIKKYRYVFYFLPISLVYLFMAHYITQPFPLFRKEWGAQNIISFSYVVVLFIFMFNCRYSFVPNSIKKVLIELGRASYHIFLIQILFFGLGLSFLNYITADFLFKNICVFSVNMLICFSAGLVFFYAERFLTQRLKSS